MASSILFAHADEGAAAAGILEIKHEGERARRQVGGVYDQRLDHKGNFDGALKQDGAHAFKDIGRCKGQGNPLEPGGQDGERIVDAAQGHEGEYQRPGDILRTETVAQQESEDEETESPARQHQVEKERDEPQAEPVDIEAEKEDRKQAHWHDADQYTDDADDHHRENM